MAEKLPGWKFVVYRGAAGSQAATLIDKNIDSVDGGGGDFDFVDLPTRGDGVTIPQTDEQPVQRKAAPKFTMIYHDTDAHIAALFAAADANPPVPLAFLFRRKLGGKTTFDGDAFIKYGAAGDIKEGQPVEFELHPTAGLRAWTCS